MKTVGGRGKFRKNLRYYHQINAPIDLLCRAPGLAGWLIREHSVYSVANKPLPYQSALLREKFVQSVAKNYTLPLGQSVSIREICG